MKVDEYTATKNPNINNFSGHPVIPLNIKNHNIALPVLTDRIKNNNIKNYEKLFISNIINNKKTNKSKLNEFFRYNHPWLNNISKIEEINSFMSYCYDITKVTPAPIKIRKLKINDSKYMDENFQKNIKSNNNYKTLNRLNLRKNKNKTINIGTNTNINRGNLSIENNNNEKRGLIPNNEIYKFKLKLYQPDSERFISNSFRNYYNSSIKKKIKKNSTITNADYAYLNSLKIKNNRCSSLNDSLNKFNNNNNLSKKSEFKTIKIKKIKNDKSDKKNIRDTAYKIQSKFKFTYI